MKPLLVFSVVYRFDFDQKSLFSRSHYFSNGLLAVRCKKLFYSSSENQDGDIFSEVGKFVSSLTFRFYFFE